MSEAPNIKREHRRRTRCWGALPATNNDSLCDVNTKTLWISRPIRFDAPAVSSCADGPKAVRISTPGMSRDGSMNLTPATQRVRVGLCNLRRGVRQFHKVLVGNEHW